MQGIRGTPLAPPATRTSHEYKYLYVRVYQVYVIPGGTDLLYVRLSTLKTDHKAGIDAPSQVGVNVWAVCHYVVLTNNNNSLTREGVRGHTKVLEPRKEDKKKTQKIKNRNSAA